jgi:hypothetical protein
MMMSMSMMKMMMMHEDEDNFRLGQLHVTIVLKNGHHQHHAS